MPTPSDLDAFLTRWADAGGREMANSQLYLSELCDVLGVDRPHPSTSDTSKHDYVFERRVEREFGDGSKHAMRIDLYNKGHFVLEAKQGASPKAAEPVFSLSAPTEHKKGIGTRGTKSWRAAMVEAKAQAEAYARDLEKGHDLPPFLVVVDVGYCIELWANFARDGKAYTQFPDRSNFRIFHRQEDAHGAPVLADAEVLKRLRGVWTAPMALDPSKKAAKLTCDVAKKLGKLATSLEKKQLVDGKEVRDYDSETVAMFLMRCLFCMFAQRVDLLPEGSFTALLVGFKGRIDQFVPMLTGLWREMDKGTPFSVILRAEKLREFNGSFFHDQTVLPVSEAQLDVLIDAAGVTWEDVEPAIFGTLLEHALDGKDRQKLGAHYTPRSYVERLVLPTVIEPLRADWLAAQKEAQLYEFNGNRAAAAERLRAFHIDLCKLRVLDPACGSGNFLYVTLEHMKRLEGEVLQAIADYEATGGKAGRLRGKEGSEQSVHPRQFLGIEVNSRAAVIAEMVLWIGYLQWQKRNIAATADPELKRKLESRAVLENLHNIGHRDAVLDWEDAPKFELKTDSDGRVVTAWDGVSTKKHPATGLNVPDESKRAPVYRYKNARKAEWPKADFVVGNPPFIGNKRMRTVLGDGYVEALRKAQADVPDTVDLVMYWWHHAAELLKAGKIRRFGFITTNSVTQTFNRQVIAKHLPTGVKLAFAVPDHPWVDSADGASVRVAMTVAACDDGTPGRVCTPVEGATGEGGEVEVPLTTTTGLIHADLKVGANVAGAMPLLGNKGLCFQGMNLVGEGFRVDGAWLAARGFDASSLPAVVRPYQRGRPLFQGGDSGYVLDCYGLQPEVIRDMHPAVYQHLLDHVKPERDNNNRKSRKERWWLFGEPVGKLRTALAGLPRFMATLETSTHKPFVFLDSAVVPDHKLYAIACTDAWVLGVLSSRPHQVWALAAGGTLEDRPTWTNGTCFLPFPFPDTSHEQQAHIRDIAERLDAHRKARQAQHRDLSLTGMYNVLQKLRSGDLTAKDKIIHDQGLCSILKQLHDELDAAVFDAYGWPTNLSDEDLLQKLVDLNAERADEERRGVVRWLRPEFQDPARKGKAQEQVLDLGSAVETASDDPIVLKKLPWPTKHGERFAALDAVLGQYKTPVAADDVAARFEGAQAAHVETLLRAVASVGGAVEIDGRWLARS